MSPAAECRVPADSTLPEMNDVFPDQSDGTSSWKPVQLLDLSTSSLLAPELFSVFWRAEFADGVPLFSQVTNA
jgi:hypothetical protein